MLKLKINEIFCSTVLTDDRYIRWETGFTGEEKPDFQLEITNTFTGYTKLIDLSYEKDSYIRLGRYDNDGNILHYYAYDRLLKNTKKLTKLSKEDIAKRRCFLCRENRPPEQIMIKFEGRKGKKYHILVNPYPIFPDHLVIAADRHTDQSILRRYVDMLDLAGKYDGYTFFYNGPRSGASAPDHHHFQAAPKGLIPLVNDVDDLISRIKNDDSSDLPLKEMITSGDAVLYHYQRFTTIE